MNKVFIIGRVTRTPELRFNNANVPYTRFSIAVNRNYTNAQGEREADFINIVAWRKQAENICKYLTKGSLVAIDGSIQTGSYDAQDGSKRYTFDILANSVQFLEPKKEQTIPRSEPQEEVKDPFADFGDTVTIDDNFLD